MEILLKKITRIELKIRELIPPNLEIVRFV